MKKVTLVNENKAYQRSLMCSFFIWFLSLQGDMSNTAAIPLIKQTNEVSETD